MSEHLHQSLSNLMDNEADELELRRLLRACDDGQISDDQDLADTWHRYHLVRSVLHRELEQESLTDIADRVSAALELEPAPDMKRSWFGPWQQRLNDLSNTWMAKGMIAAGVALAVVLLLPNPQPESTEPQLAAQSVPEQPVASGTGYGQSSLAARSLLQATPGVQRVSVGQGAEGFRLVDHQTLKQQRLIQGYLIQHSEYVAASGSHGMLPMARASGYQTTGQQ